MKELDNLISGNEIDAEYHDKIFNNDLFEKMYTKINLDDFKDIKNKIYWLSLLIYRISMVNYLDSINEDVDFEKGSITLKKDNIIVFHPAMNISSEFCKMLKSGYIYPSYPSLLCRQIIEQICFISEIKNENIDEKSIIEASIESYNKQLGAKSLNSDGLNNNNKGLLKVFQNNITYGKLAKKYNYSYMYKFFSGDIHSISQISKLIPFASKGDDDYYDIYFQCILSLLRDFLIIISEYNIKVKLNLEEINSIDFIEIKDENN